MDPIVGGVEGGIYAGGRTGLGMNNTNSCSECSEALAPACAKDGMWCSGRDLAGPRGETDAGRPGQRIAVIATGALLLAVFTGSPYRDW